jgi:threonine dehydratase
MKEFLEFVLGPTVDIVFFEYSKKTSRERGPALVGIELSKQEEFPALIERLEKSNVQFTYINDKPDLFEFLI